MVGLAIKGKFRPAEWRSVFFTRFRDVVPTLPEIQAAQIPQPPLVPKRSEPKKAWFLAQAFQTAVLNYYDRCWYFRGVTESTIVRSKHYPSLIDALPYFEQYRIAPVAWIAFSIEVYDRFATKPALRWNDTPSEKRGAPKRMPALRWVLSTNRLENRTEWFAWYEQKFQGGRLIYSKSHLVLMRQHSRMWAALMIEQEPDLARVNAIVQQYLPKQRLTRLVEAAQTESELLQHDINQMFKKGAFLWGQQTTTDLIQTSRRSLPFYAAPAQSSTARSAPSSIPKASEMKRASSRSRLVDRLPKT